MYVAFRDKTWKWDHGAGYFFDEGRRFIAWTSDESGKSYGEGRYTLSDSGRLCLKAAWTSAKGTGDSTACFLNRTDGKKIYQQRAGSEEWYVIVGGEEPSQFVAGDSVSADYDRVKQDLNN
jgi:hypothetical protein